MNLDYLNHITGGSPFYQPVENKENSGWQKINRIHAPRGWFSILRAPWESWCPCGIKMPVQGWKIHVSATLDNAIEIFEKVSCICIKREVSFKFVPTLEQLMMLNSKNANRSFSGKFITIYPKTRQELTDIVDLLEPKIGGLPGPYILSDVRHGLGPIYFRYGGFQPLYSVNNFDEKIPSIINEKGVLIPDRRLPYFQKPQYVEIPHIVDEAVKKRMDKSKDASLENYSSIKALHFSNSGGVYQVVNQGKGNVSVLKEARPYAGLDRRGRDAVTRLQCEARNLRTLFGTGLVPKVIDEFKTWEHHFLELEFLQGTTLNSWTVLSLSF